MGTRIREIMTSRPRSASPETPLSQVAELMSSEDVGAMPVVDGERLVGMVTDRDIVVRAIAEGKDPRGMPVAEVMSRDLLAVRPDDDLRDARELMAAHQVRRLPVVDEDDNLIGIVSQADVALEAKEKDTGEMLEEISKPPSGPRVG